MLIIELTYGVTKQKARQTFHNCLKIIWKPIQLYSETRINLLVNNKYIWFFPKISTIIADWLEATTFCLIYKLVSSNYLCYFCLVNRKNLANLKLTKYDLKLRNYENMLNYYNNNEENTVCIESVQNIF